MTNDKANGFEIATLGGGCFWCLEAVYKDLKGVQRVVSGYAGGHVPQPSYQQVTRGTTGHAEVVQVHYDPQIISFEELLQIFFTIHDPTTLNRQGNDVGPQYRSIILYHDDQQRQAAEQAVQDAQELWSKPIVTEIEPLETFYEAEAYHQDYFERNPYQSYCQVVIAPKVSKFRKQYVEKLKKEVV